MTTKLNSKLFNILESLKGDETPLLRGTSKEVIDCMKSNSSKPAYEVELDSFETNITSKTIVDWIAPLQFERNLNEALDALEAADALLREERNRVLIEMQQNYIKAMLSSETMSSELSKHNDLISDLEMEQYSNSINLRFAKKVIDLIEYTKAAKLGAKVLYGVNEPEFEYQGNEVGINKIRESLRSLLEISRNLDTQSQEIIVPVSLKSAKNTAGNYLIEKWDTDPENRHTNVSLKDNTLEFDLAQFESIKSLKFQRIRRIGIQILDKYSNTLQKSDGALLNNRDNYWNVVMTDADDGLSLGTSALSPKHKIKPIKFSDVAASRKLTDINWSRYSSIVNFNANRKWKIDVSEKSHHGISSEDILDIVVHFHIAFQTR